MLRFDACTEMELNSGTQTYDSNLEKNNAKFMDDNINRY